MPTEAVRVYRARCAVCGWFGEWRNTYGQAVGDDRHHRHYADVENTLAALLAMFGHAVSRPLLVDRGRREPPLTVSSA